MPAGYIRLSPGKEEGHYSNPKGQIGRNTVPQPSSPQPEELSAVSGVDVRNEDKEIHSAADRILKEYNLTSLLVTRSEKACHT